VLFGTKCEEFSERNLRTHKELPLKPFSQPSYLIKCMPRVCAKQYLVCAKNIYAVFACVFVCVCVCVRAQ